MKYVVKALLVLVVMGAAIFTLAGSADASHATLKVVAPANLTAGDSVDIQAVLHSAHGGEAVPGATISFYMDGSFGGVEGKVLLGQALTDKDGVAHLSYLPRTAGEHQVHVEYLTPGESEPEVATWSHDVSGAPHQFYRSSAGVQIPGLNVWLLMGVLAGVWAILLSVAARVIAIAGAGSEAVAGAPASRSRATGDW
ncbi:MAG: Ig-like domain-containing protein [Dehalococcoidia bacterium]|nr:Ig-like domain-containing protein [Dehalococcoidia bacterium]